MCIKQKMFLYAFQNIFSVIQIFIQLYLPNVHKYLPELFIENLL